MATGIYRQKYMTTVKVKLSFKPKLQTKFDIFYLFLLSKSPLKVIFHQLTNLLLQVKSSVLLLAIHMLQHLYTVLLWAPQYRLQPTP